MMNSTHELASVLRIIMLKDLSIQREKRRKKSRGGNKKKFIDGINFLLQFLGFEPG